jgi:hypothetical protein
LKPSSKQLPPIRLNGAQFIVALTATVVLAASVGLATWPSLRVEYLRRYGIPRYGAAYGFVFGQLQAAYPTGQVLWGFSAVAEGGTFARAGVRQGDVPFDHHGWGEMGLYDVLSNGQGIFHVFNAVAVPPTNGPVREIRIPAP